MYKKIAHNIIEEHFDGPGIIARCPAPPPSPPTGSGSVTNSAGGNGDTYGNVPGRELPDEEISMGDGLPYYTMNEETMQFRMDQRTAWGKWAWSLLNYSISLNGNLPGTEQVKARLMKNAMALGESIVPFYGLTAGQLLGSALIAISEVGTEYVEALKAGKPTADIVVQWEPLIDNLVKILNELNPNNWPEVMMKDIFVNLVNAWQAQLKARADGDIVADELAIDYINKLVITGLAKFDPRGYASLADVFSRGIIAQFPDMFSSY